MSDKFAGKSDEAVTKATGKSWSEWFRLLDSAKIKDLPHKEMVLWLWDNKLVKSGWWAQSIIVGYEEKIGRRVYGAKTPGNYTVTIGKTMDGTPDAVLKLWQNLVKGKKEFNKIKVKSDSRTSSTKDWRYWKVDLVDGSKIMVGIGLKEDNKSTFSVTMDKLKDEKAVEEWRRYWKKFFEKNLTTF